MHFVVLQALAILFAVIASSLDFYVPWEPGFRRVLNFGEIVGGAIGYGVFIYALMSVVAVCMHLFRIAEMYAEWHKSEAAKAKQDDDAQPGSHEGHA